MGRATEINAVLGLNQLQYLDNNNEKRVKNFDCFLKHLDSNHFYTEFDTEGAVNYAFLVVLKDANDALRDKLEAGMRESGIEFRRGTSGGGNQLRQPYLRNLVGENYHLEFKNTDHIHFYGYYIGNFPSLTEDKIVALCNRLNTIVKEK